MGKDKKQNKSEAKVRQSRKITIPPSKTDVLGSYTGNPDSEQKLPEQDADDL